MIYLRQPTKGAGGGSRATTRARQAIVRAALSASSATRHNDAAAYLKG